MDDLDKYCQRFLAAGATDAKSIQSSSIITAEWVRLKCQFGCPNYGTRYCCPPDTPTPEQTRAVINNYERGILIHYKSDYSPDRRKHQDIFLDKLRDLEIEMFHDGYYKAFILLSGYCTLCKECGKVKGNPCKFGYRARPSMEACGIDVFQTARNNAFPIDPLRTREETRNLYCLMLVD